jgi:hypothetical protein
MSKRCRSLEKFGFVDVFLLLLFLKFFFLLRRGAILYPISLLLRFGSLNNIMPPSSFREESALLIGTFYSSYLF